MVIFIRIFRVIEYLQHKDIEHVRGGIKAVTVWQHKDFWEVIQERHEYHCNRLGEYISNSYEVNGDCMIQFFAIHEAVVAFENPDSLTCLQKSYDTICQTLQHQPILLQATLSTFFNVIPPKLLYGDLLFAMWRAHDLINVPVLKMLLDVSGKEKEILMAQWQAFLMGTHPRVGADSPVQILRRKIDALDLIFTEFDTIRKRSIELISNPSFGLWNRGNAKQFDKGLFCVAMGVLIIEAPNSIVCTVLEHCVRNCTCHDASFICEYTTQVDTPTYELIASLLKCASHWNFYVHDPARMALLCMNQPSIDKQLEDQLHQPIHTLSVFKPVHEGCLPNERRWKSFL